MNNDICYCTVIGLEISTKIIQHVRFNNNQTNTYNREIHVSIS